VGSFRWYVPLHRRLANPANKVPLFQLRILPAATGLLAYFFTRGSSSFNLRSSVFRKVTFWV